MYLMRVCYRIQDFVSLSLILSAFTGQLRSQYTNSYEQLRMKYCTKIDTFYDMNYKTNRILTVETSWGRLYGSLNLSPDDGMDLEVVFSKDEGQVFPGEKEYSDRSEQGLLTKHLRCGCGAVSLEERDSSAV